jgi:hypothetical protein
MARDYYQTMKLSFEQICQGQYVWIPLGNFMHEWYAERFSERERLIVDPIAEVYPREYEQWAAFCAASVRWFCATYEITCPSWVDKPQYVLAEPWYMDYPRKYWRERRKETAEEFRRHNIFCGNRVYINKYERDEEGWPLREHPVNLQERLAVVRPANERLAREWADLERRIREYMPTAEALRAAARAREQALAQENMSL